MFHFPPEAAQSGDSLQLTLLDVYDVMGLGFQGLGLN